MKGIRCGVKVMSILQAVLQKVHIKHFWEQHSGDPTPDVEQTEALLMASLQV